MIILLKRLRVSFHPQIRTDDEDDVSYYIGEKLERLKLEGETEDAGV